MKSKTLTYLVLGAVLAVGIQPTFASAADTITAKATATTAVADRNSKNLEQTGIFKEGPGIAVVSTDAGKLQGYVQDDIYNYRGVQYAEAKERFKPATPVEHWDGIKMAVNNGPISPQPKGGFLDDWGQPGREFKEDNNAQNLNIWTPGINDNQKRPVMVWIHGGGFSNGSSLESPTYDGQNLAKEGDVVVVSVNHRLNGVGYLDLSAYGDQYKESGNVGMHDIVDSLKWIKTNIANFGGDPNNVTVFGESGGGAKVLALMTTPEAKGLFQKGIVESGATETMGVYFNTKPFAQRVAALTLEKLNIAPDEVDKIQSVPMDQFQKVSNEALEQAGIEFGIKRPLDGQPGGSWEPVVDGNFMPSDPVLDNGFAEAGKDVSLLIGSNRTEWTNYQDILNIEKTQYDNVNTWSDAEIDAKLKEKYGDKADAVVTEFLKAYPNKKKGDALYIDTMIRNPMRKIMTHKADQNGAPVYAYVFTYDAPVMNGVYMSYHTSEIPFVFHNVDKGITRIGGDANAKTLEKHMSQAWVNFARTGNPNVKGQPEWKPYTRDNGNTMIFDTESRAVSHHDKALMDLLTPDYKY